MKYFKPLAQVGDTIVEVMVVLAVLGSAITISYVTATRSLANSRQAQESTQASEYVQQQVETLHAMQSLYINNDPTTNIFRNGTYCTYYDTGSSGYKLILVANDTTGFCTKNNLYHLKINYNASANDTFTVVATWPDVLGQGDDTSTIVYRLHKP